MSEVKVVSPMVEELFSDAAAIGFVEVVEVKAAPANGLPPAYKTDRYYAPASCRNPHERVVVEDDGDVLWAK